jgi:TipAS antibiotic-recognition domain
MDPFRVVRRDESAAQQEEAEAGWGSSERFRESKRRTSRYTLADWAMIRLEARTIVEALGAAFRDGVPVATALSTSSTRRFFARPSSVLFGATGLAKETPTGVSRSLAME